MTPGPEALERRRSACRELLRLSLDRLRPCPTSIAVFGSFAGGTLHPDSDLDLLLAGPEVPRRPYARAQWASPLKEAWRAARDSSFRDAPSSLSILFMPAEGLRESVGLRLSWATRIWVLRDDGLLSHAVNEAARWLAEGLWRREALPRGGYVWRPREVAS